MDAEEYRKKRRDPLFLRRETVGFAMARKFSNGRDYCAMLAPQSLDEYILEVKLDGWRNYQLIPLDDPSFFHWVEKILTPLGLTTEELLDWYLHRKACA